MKDGSERTLDRVGAVAGLASVVLIVSLVTVMPALPAPNKSVESIASSATNNRSGLLLAAYLGSLASGALLVFGAAVAARLRRAEGSATAWWIVSLVGITAAGAIGFVSDALVIVLVRAVGHGVRGDVLWLAYGGDHWIGVLTGVPLAIFLLGAGLGAHSGAALPRWAGILGLVAALALAVGAAGVVGGEVDGGPLGSAQLLGYLGLLVWTIAVSVVLWRRPSALRVEAAPGLA